MNVVEEYIRKLSSLPTTKCIAIREVNTRCPRTDITWGSGSYHDLHQTRLLDTSPETFTSHVTEKVNHGFLDVKGFRLQPFKTHHQEICQLNAPPVQFLSKSRVWTMPVQFQTRPVPREKPEKPTSCCLQRCLSRVSSDS